MISKTELVERMGKRGARDFIVQNRNKNEKTGHEKTCGIRGRIKFRRCEHGIWVINNYEPQYCQECHEAPRPTKTKDFRPYFNMGLGAYVESRGEEKRLARSMGLEEAG